MCSVEGGAVGLGPFYTSEQNAAVYRLDRLNILAILHEQLTLRRQTARNPRVKSFPILYERSNLFKRVMDLVQIGCVVVNQLQLLESLRKERKKRRWCTHPLLSNRLTVGIFHVTFAEHRRYPDKFFQYYRMSVPTFDELLELISPHIVKRDTVMKRSIDPAERLVITLR